jgi:hypothetical protein
MHVERLNTMSMLPAIQFQSFGNGSRSSATQSSPALSATFAVRTS